MAICNAGSLKIETFVFVDQGGLVIFYSEDVETKEITVKLLKIIKHTFKNTTYSKTIRFRFIFRLISIISRVSRIVKAD